METMGWGVCGHAVNDRVAYGKVGWGCGDGQALFIRVDVVVPQIWHSLTRYGSRENAAFSRLSDSVCIWTRTACGVSRSHVEQCSAMSTPSFIAAIPSEPSRV